MYDCSRPVEEEKKKQKGEPTGNKNTESHRELGPNSAVVQHSNDPLIEASFFDLVSYNNGTIYCIVLSDTMK